MNVKLSHPWLVVMPWSALFRMAWLEAKSSVYDFDPEDVQSIRRLKQIR